MTADTFLVEGNKQEHQLSNLKPSTTYSVALYATKGPLTSGTVITNLQTRMCLFYSAQWLSGHSWCLTAGCLFQCGTQMFSFHPNILYVCWFLWHFFTPNSLRSSPTFLANQGSFLFTTALSCLICWTVRLVVMMTAWKSFFIISLSSDYVHISQQMHVTCLDTSQPNCDCFEKPAIWWVRNSLFDSCCQAVLPFHWHHIIVSNVLFFRH